MDAMISAGRGVMAPTNQSGTNPAVPRQAEEMAENIAVFGKIFEELESRLSPILGPSEPQSNNKNGATQPNVSLSPLADRLRDFNYHLRGLIDRAREMLHRLEI
jgi:hypothetical protein